MFKFLRWEKPADDTIDLEKIDDFYENLKEDYPNQFNEDF